MPASAAEPVHRRLARLAAELGQVTDADADAAIGPEQYRDAQRLIAEALAVLVPDLEAAAPTPGTHRRMLARDLHLTIDLLAAATADPATGAPAC